MHYFSHCISNINNLWIKQKTRKKAIDPLGLNLKKNSQNLTTKPILSDKKVIITLF